MKYSEQYYDVYEMLPEKLAEKYPELSFDNHCYLRIALDNMASTKWDTVILRLAYKHLSLEQRKEIIRLLKAYFYDKSLLLRHNQQSLQYRKK
ncbi:hypothetical protein [Aquimarina spongiae]|uniref:Uncharacterized protein n=1 Tax=Aquimarina spongiae TaxID=570521 RepID=A0A1M6GPT0_9FLAO|nr:hypothetical protein [Aquimarina spongiae]SHJ11896.1 hypothetical protein SAMN04488508_105385 [Aquimarina spongiae]